MHFTTLVGDGKRGYSRCSADAWAKVRREVRTKSGMIYKISHRTPKDPVYTIAKTTLLVAHVSDNLTELFIVQSDDSASR